VRQQAHTAWWPHEGQPYYLVDAPEDCGVEERCWVPVRAIESDEFAEQRATGGLLAAALAFIDSSNHADYALVEDGFALTLSGSREWQRPNAVPASEGEWPVTGDDGETYRSEFCPWVTCEPDDPQAVEFYVLELVETGQ
jgi:hypothetical protein